MRIVHVSQKDVEAALENTPKEAENFLSGSQISWLACIFILLVTVSYITETPVFVVVVTAATLWYAFCIVTVLLSSKGKG